MKKQIKNLIDLYEIVKKVKSKDYGKEFKWNNFDIKIGNSFKGFVEIFIDCNDGFGWYEVHFHLSLPMKDCLISAADDMKDLRYQIDSYLANMDFYFYQKSLKELDEILDPYYVKN